MFNEKSIEVLPLFPSPLFTYVYDKDLSETRNYLDTIKLIDGGMANQYGFHSKNTYILDHPDCSEINNFIMQSIKYFAKEILMYSYEEYCFSQSWISHKAPGQYHTMHTHPNSLISGVFYYGEYDQDVPAITFHKPVFGTNASHLSPQYQSDRRKSQYAWETFSVNPSDGLLILFPSYILHSVPLNNTSKVRKSLAFNVMPKSRIGQEQNLTELLFHKVL
jgi:uncharacterized protein (TIGR02466 family)